VTEYSATTLISGGILAELDSYGNLIIDLIDLGKLSG